MKQRKIYDRDFKENAVRLSLQRDDIRSLARELGVTTKLLYGWRSDFKKKGSESFPGKDHTAVTPEAKLQEQLRKENEILKKALGIISEGTEKPLILGFHPSHKPCRRGIFQKKELFQCPHHFQERTVIYAFIKEHEYLYTVEMMCKVLTISRSSYYKWKKSPLTKSQERRKRMQQQIKDAYGLSKGRYGSPRIAEDLCAGGTIISRRTVAKYMKEMGLRSKVWRKHKVTTDSSHKEPVAENILNRDFTCLSPAGKCVSDITYLKWL